MQEAITEYDYWLLPFYIFLFYLIARHYSNYYKGTPLRKYFIHGFFIRMAGSIFCGMLFQYYYGYGDTLGYYEGSNVISSLIEKDIGNISHYFSSADDLAAAAKNAGLGANIPVHFYDRSNVTVMKIASLISFFTFNKFLLIGITFGFFSFIGIWKIYYVLYQINNKRNARLLAIAILYWPSLAIWGGGLLKEPLCVGALGILIGHLYKVFYKKTFSTWDLIVMALMILLISLVKLYVIVIFMAAVFMMLVVKFFKSIRIKIWRYTTIFFLGFILLALFTFIDPSAIVQPIIDISFDRIETYKNSYQMIQEQDESSRAGFILGDIYPTMSSLLSNSPIAIGNCLFRPFVWESPKIIMFLSAIESLITMLVTLYVLWKTRFIGFFVTIFTSPAITFCFVFSMLLALLIGFTTFNFGTVARYKIIFLPFYFAMLIIIYSHYTYGRRDLS